MNLDISELKSFIYDVVGALYEVHKELGPGLNEYCYQEGLEMELSERNITYERELSFHPTYHGIEMNAEYRIDFLCKGKIIIECKSVTELTNTHRAQLFNYMRLRGIPCGILVNFADKQVEIERYFYDKLDKDILSVDGRVIFHRGR
jgi:GxxExxY protein